MNFETEALPRVPIMGKTELPNLTYTHTRVMVVDDERLIADMFATILNHNGYRALPVYSAHDAVQHARMIRFDLALLGVRMPGMNGARTGILIRRLQPSCKIVLWVEDIPPKIHSFAHTYGFRFEHVRLPIPPLDFLRTIQQLSE